MSSIPAGDDSKKATGIPPSSDPALTSSSEPTALTSGGAEAREAQPARASSQLEMASITSSPGGHKVLPSALRAEALGRANLSPLPSQVPIEPFEEMPTSTSASSKPGVQWSDKPSGVKLNPQLVALEERLLAKISKAEHHLDKKLNSILEHLDKRKSRRSGSFRRHKNAEIPAAAMPEQTNGVGYPLNYEQPGDSEASGVALGNAQESESESESDDGAASEAGSSTATSTHFSGDNYMDEESDTEKAPLVLVESDEWMINPRNQFRMIWDLCILLPFLMYLTIVMPFRMTFSNEAEVYSAMYWFEFTIDMVFIVDIFLNFRTGYILEGVMGEGHGKDDMLIEFDRKRVAWNYGTSWFVLDVVSGIPFALIELILGALEGESADATGSGGGQLKSLKSLKLLRFLKLGRLLKLEKILSSLDRDTLDRIQDFANNGRTQSIAMCAKLLLLMTFSCHLLGCFWVLVGRYSLNNGLVSWLESDINGPFIMKDTTGGKHVYSIYLAAFYYSLTTMTSIGYGEITPTNNVERLFAVFLEIIGAIIYASIIANITSLITSTDANTRNKKEQLEMVSSFCEAREIPKDMARNIRRHFRHFYERKSAIDETQIFNELSSNLRKEVSAYIVEELMGSESFFMSLSPTLWPFVLPLLRPTSFEPLEKVCAQGEDASDMYVVLSGVLKAETAVPMEVLPRVRHVLTGQTVNILHAVGVWNKCPETVVAREMTETYALSDNDFVGLFSTDTERENLNEMRALEVKKFRMDRISTAPTKFGKPLYLKCFSSVELKVNMAHISDKYLYSKKRQKLTSKGGDGVTWFIADLLDTFSGRPLHEIWRFKSSPISIKTCDEAVETSTEVFTKVGNFDDTVRFDDISVRFDSASIRVRVFINGDAEDVMVGRTLLPLVNYSATRPRGAAATDTARLRLEINRQTKLMRSQSVSPGKMIRRNSTISEGGRFKIVEPEEDLIECWCPLEFGPNGLQAPLETTTSAAVNRWDALRREIRSVSEDTADSALPQERPKTENQGINSFQGIEGTKKTAKFSILAALQKAKVNPATKSAGGQVHLAMLAHMPERKAKKALSDAKKGKKSGGAASGMPQVKPSSSGSEAPASGGILKKLLALREQDPTDTKEGEANTQTLV